MKAKKKPKAQVDDQDAYITGVTGSPLRYYLILCTFSSHKN